MKRIIFTAMVFAFVANVSAQLKVDAAGDTRISKNIYLESASNILGTMASNVPITFKVNGILAGYTGRLGKENVSFGYEALASNTGGYNTAIGYSALYSNTVGWYNTANGHSALYSNTTGYYNVATGHITLYGNTTGNYNTAIGYGALYSNITGNYNTTIGCVANVNAGNLSNTTAIGHEARTTSSSQVRIGNSSVTSIGGYASWSNISDKRTKKNIRADVPGLAFINGLQPVTYNLDLDAIDGLLKIDKTKKEGEEELFQELKDIKKAREAKEKQLQTGFIAQDVEAVAKSIGYDFSGVDVDEIGIYGLRYAEFVAPLVKAVQELSEQNEWLQAQVDELKAGRLTDGLEFRNVADIASTQRGLQAAALYQNSPNPFNQTTEIGYYIPEAVKSANIYIYDLNGVLQKNIIIDGYGNGKVAIEASALKVGIYFYTLLCDGSPVDSKQMILTK
jgi:hypothetical protein